MSRNINFCRRWLPVAATVAALVMPGAAQALFTVNFDVDGNGDPILNGQVINDQYTLANGGIVDSDSGAKVGMSVSAINGGGGPNLAVAFDTRLTGTADPDLQDPFRDTAQTDPDNTDPELRSPGNILIVQENSTGCSTGTCTSPDDEAGGPNTFTFTFSEVVTLFSLDLFDVDGTPDNQMETVEMVLRDNAGNSLFTTTNFGTGGNNTAARVTFGAGVMNVAMLEVAFSSSGALSNIKGAVPSVSVPEPGTLGLLALGLAGGLAGARRKRAAAQAVQRAR